jgi:hypothetical protein
VEEQGTTGGGHEWKNGVQGRAVEHEVSRMVGIRVPANAPRDAMATNMPP